jgi:hypothetical protein
MSALTRLHQMITICDRPNDLDDLAISDQRAFIPFLDETTPVMLRTQKLIAKADGFLLEDQFDSADRCCDLIVGSLVELRGQMRQRGIMQQYCDRTMRL